MLFYCFGNLYERGMIAIMTFEGLIAVMSLILTAFGLGVYYGNKFPGSNKSQKYPPTSGKLSGIFVKLFY